MKLKDIVKVHQITTVCSSQYRAAALKDIVKVHQTPIWLNCADRYSAYDNNL